MANLCPSCKKSKCCKLGTAINNGVLDDNIDPYLADYAEGFNEFPFVEVFVTDCEKYEEDV